MTDSEIETGTNFSRKRFSSRSPRQTPEKQQQQQQQQQHKISPKSSPKMSPKMSPKKSSKKADGYEADTDDTLQRRIRRKSVKELAGMFQRAENACPSPVPFRPKTFADSDYDSDSRTTDSIIFNQSRAYIPPKWAPAEMSDKSVPQKIEKIISASENMSDKFCSTKMESNQEKTSILRLNQCEMMSTNLISSTTTSFESSTKASFSKEISSNFRNGSFENSEVKQIPIFTPKKFVPMEPKAGEEQSSILQSIGSESTDGLKIKPKWTPSAGSKNEEEPAYRKIRPNFDARKSLDRSASTLFKKVPADRDVKVGDQVSD